MIKKMLSILKKELDKLNIRNEYMYYTETPQYPYWTYEYFENENNSENGYKDVSIILDGFIRDSYFTLEQEKEKISIHFADLRIENISFTYENGGPVRTEDLTLKKIQINLNARAWKGN